MVYRSLTSREVQDEAAEQRFLTSHRSQDHQGVERARLKQYEALLRAEAMRAQKARDPEEKFFGGDTAFNTPKPKSPLRMTPAERMQASDKINDQARQERGIIETEQPDTTMNDFQAAA